MPKILNKFLDLDALLPSFVRLTGTTGTALSQSTNGTFSYTLADWAGTGYDASKVTAVHVFCEATIQDDAAAEIFADYPDGTEETIWELSGGSESTPGHKQAAMIVFPIDPGQTTLDLRISESGAGTAQCVFTIKGVTQQG